MLSNAEENEYRINNVPAKHLLVAEPPHDIHGAKNATDGDESETFISELNFCIGLATLGQAVMHYSDEHEFNCKKNRPYAPKEKQSQNN